MKRPNYKFCTKQFKPIIVFVVIITIVVVGWTTFRHDSFKSENGLMMGKNGSVMPIATAPPITPGQAAPHPNWGNCSNCHDLIPAKKGGIGEEKTAAAMMVATAPPISNNLPAPHPNWGACTKCHQILGGTTKGLELKPAATAAPFLGVWLDPITPEVADKFGLANTDGVFISGVYGASLAQNAGLKVGDVITRIDNEKVENVGEALGMLAEVNPKNVLKLQVLHEGRTRNLFVNLAEGQPDPLSPQTTVVGAIRPSLGRIAVAATSGDLQAQVSPVFGGSPFFIFYDPAKRQYSVVKNVGLGSPTPGQTAASQLARAQVQAVIVGNIGPGSFRILQTSGMQVYTGAFGSVPDVIGQYLEGKLVAANGTAVAPSVSVTPGNNQALSGKVAVASTGPGVDAQVASDVMLAPYLIIYDFQNKQYESIALKPTMAQDANAVQLAHLIVDRGALAVISGNVPPPLVQSLSKLGVFSFAGVSGSVGQAIAMYRSGKLQATTVPAIGLGQGAGGKVTL